MSKETVVTTEIERASLSSVTTFFEYALGEERGYLWVIGGEIGRAHV